MDETQTRALFAAVGRVEKKVDGALTKLDGLTGEFREHRGEDRASFDGLEARIGRIETNADASGRHQIVTLEQRGTWVKSALVTVGVALFTAIVTVLVTLSVRR